MYRSEDNLGSKIICASFCAGICTIVGIFGAIVTVVGMYTSGSSLVGVGIGLVAGGRGKLCDLLLQRLCDGVQYLFTIIT